MKDVFYLNKFLTGYLFSAYNILQYKFLYNIFLLYFSLYINKVINNFCQTMGFKTYL